MFGEVLSGKSIIRQIENEPSQGDKPSRDCVVTDCGQLQGADAENIPQKQPDALGDPYEDYPDDEKAGGEDLLGTQILKIATDLKGLGNTAFKNNDQKRAIEKYQKGLRYLHEYPEPLEGDPKDLGGNLNQLKIVLHSNSALCYIKRNQNDKAENSASAALEVPGISDADQGKALYRRALARGGLKDDEAAMKDLEEAAKIVPDDGNVKNELNKMKARAADKAKKEKAQYKKFFA